MNAFPNGFARRLLRIYLFSWIGIGIYFLIGVLQFDLHEGIWEILFKVSMPVFLFGLLPLIYVNLRYNIGEFSSNPKMLFGSIFLIGFMMFFAKDFFNEFYNSIFEKTKSTVSNEYLTHIKTYRGTKQYYLYFDDKSEPDNFDPEIQKCHFSYKFRINSDTYQELNKLSDWAKNEKYTDLKNPLIEITFKPKAEILMNYQIKNSF